MKGERTGATRDRDREKGADGRETEGCAVVGKRGDVERRNQARDGMGVIY